MKDILATVGKIGGLVFAALVIGFTSWLTWLLAKRLIPDSTVLQFMTLALFDGAALVWFIQFITQAKGTLQWAISGIGFLVGLAGAVIMAGGELILGQSLVVVEDPTTMGWVLVSTVIVAALAHASLVYAFHFTDPSVKNRIENAQQVSKAIEKAYGDARQEIERHTQELTAGLRESVLYEAQQQIGAATAAHIRGAALLQEKTGEAMRGGGVIIPGTARDAGTSAQPWQDEEEDESEDERALLDVILEELAELRAAVNAKQQQAATLTAEVVTPEPSKNGNGAG